MATIGYLQKLFCGVRLATPRNRRCVALPCGVLPRLATAGVPARCSAGVLCRNALPQCCSRVPAVPSCSAIARYCTAVPSRSALPMLS